LYYFSSFLIIIICFWISCFFIDVRGGGNENERRGERKGKVMNFTRNENVKESKMIENK
jgi:hypothetical protein